jgi:hypothetical protein
VQATRLSGVVLTSACGAGPRGGAPSAFLALQGLLKQLAVPADPVGALAPGQEVALVVTLVSARHRLIGQTKVCCGDTDPGLDAYAPGRRPTRCSLDGSLSAAVAVVVVLEGELMVVV